ncbi:MAG: tRNA (adenosine(37)-N6)-dimethylallyltransferase MiaA [Ginsengibacter sp.]
MKKTCLIISGPTAVGKTSLAIELAQKHNTEIISADSRQCFKELNIGVAKPDSCQLKLIKHHFINSHSIHDEMNAAIFEEYALKAAKEIFQKKDIAIVVGGTGLYIKAFAKGLDEVPPINVALRDELNQKYTSNGIDWLKNEIEIHDKVFFERGEIQNPQRMLRALEVKLSTGNSILDYHSGKNIQRDFDIQNIFLNLPREQLYKNINHRVDKMMEEGLLEEVRDLIPFKHLNALQTVGYRELFNFFEGKIFLEKAVDDIKKNTRHYAKRQLTWFSRNL